MKCLLNRVKRKHHIRNYGKKEINAVEAILALAEA